MAKTLTNIIQYAHNKLVLYLSKAVHSADDFFFCLMRLYKKCRLAAVYLCFIFSLCGPF